MPAAIPRGGFSYPPRLPSPGVRMECFSISRYRVTRDTPKCRAALAMFLVSVNAQISACSPAWDLISRRVFR